MLLLSDGSGVKQIQFFFPVFLHKLIITLQAWLNNTQLQSHIDKLIAHLKGL